jgi:hypothetical protein
MAHYFAQIDDRNIVQRVIVVSDEDCCDSNNTHNEECGITFCKLLVQDPTSRWKESFKDGSQRGRAAGIGFKYDSELNAYIPPQPFPSWTLNTTTFDWDPPHAMPELTAEQLEARSYYQWNEVAYMADNSQGWTLLTVNQDSE